LVHEYRLHKLLEVCLLDCEQLEGHVTRGAAW
jgi:hypothetical protein